MRFVQKEGYKIFKGIPYATAGRFEKPVQLPLDPDFDATHWPASAFQAGFMPGTFYDKEFYAGEIEPDMSEDCLTLNIYVPDTAHNCKVAFWIHGGGFDHGYSWEKEFDGAVFCRHDIILVTIQYRVGILGFCMSDNPENWNAGIQDQLCALHWVYDNIAWFGGDPKGITIFGQSAGCMSVECLLSMPKAWPMIHGAILQSGLGIDPGRSVAEAKALMEKFMSENHLSQDQLQTIEAGKLIQMQSAFLEQNPLAFCPVVDGTILPAAFMQAKLPQVPMMVGCTYNDIFTDPQSLAMGDRGMIYKGCLAFASAMKAQGRPVYMYDFIRQLPGDDAGAFHSSELWYVFDTMKRCWREWLPQDYTLAARMQEIWCSFIKTGHPGFAPWPYIEVLDR